MAPTPQFTEVQEEPKMRPPPGEEVVISGMSGIFPKSNNVKEFMENLYNKVDMVTSENPRWVFNHPEVPKHLGKVDGMGKFDAQFFRVHYKQACTMEPMSRKLLEHAYSAIYDAGINPLQLRGTKVGVFIGSTFSESEKIVIYENIQRNGFGITGCNKAMYANRISYWMDSKGPSYALDLACASSMACLEHAYRSISSGLCESAIVGGCNLCMHPNVSLHCRRAGFLSLDGKTRCFDKNCDGYVRSDAICVMFLQKAKTAKRIYSEVYHAKTSYSPTSERLLPIREPKELQEFLKAFYSEIDVSPRDVEYIEANGAAIVEADTNELQAISQVFAKDKPIQIGCIKSNMGSSEPASGMCSLVKACLAYHNGKLPGNLHFEEPLDIPELKDGKVQVLTDSVNFNRGPIALNTFSYSGANVHVLLKGHHKIKDLNKYKTSIPHIILISGRQNECVESVIKILKNNPVDPEEIGLLHNIHVYDIPGHMSRGYTILSTNEDNKTVCLSQSVEYCPGKTRPLWFVYSGMGSQWAGMGTELMRIPIFSAAIQKCHKVLEPKGIDIVKILTDPDKTIYDNILHSFVGIAAVQIGLTDVLREMGIVPDQIIGHSVGELGCAYADGCFTAEEMILSAYSRGLVSIQTPFIRGSMAAVGLGYKNILPLCPPEIEVACHNSSDSATISGPADIMKQFVSELTSQGIFAKEVPCSNIAYHSRYIADAGPGLLKYLSEVIVNPKLRSSKWVSTSVPQDKWHETVAKFSSAEYHTNNLLNSVLFEETAKLIPHDAILIEIAPHGLLQAILKRSHTECVHVPLTRRGTSDPVKFLLEAVGKLYEAGLNPKVEVLYPKIEYPVSTGTPFLSHYVEWEHSEDWPQARFNNKDRKIATVRDFVMSIHDDDFKYLKGHIRDGHYVFPEAAFLYITWETLAMYKGLDYNKMSVSFQDVHFHGEAIIKTELPLRLQIMIHKGNNKFEVSYEDSTIVSGFIYQLKDTNFGKRLEEKEDDKETVILTSDDVYTIMSLKGYSYQDEFKSIASINSVRNKAHLKWSNNWITFLDSLIQFNHFANDFDGVSIPALIKTLSIDVEKHETTDKLVTNKVPCMKAELHKLYEYIKCGGVELGKVLFKNIPAIEKMPEVLLHKEFVPHFLTGTIDIDTSLEINLQIVSDNVDNNEVKIINATSKTNSITSSLKQASLKFPSVDFLIEELKENSFNDINLVLVENFLGDATKMQSLHKLLSNSTFILAIEDAKNAIALKYDLFDVITIMNIPNQILVLLKNKTVAENIPIAYVPIVEDSNFTWIKRLQAELSKSRKVVLVAEKQGVCGLYGMVKKLRKEYGNRISLVMIDDFHVASFNPEISLYKEQLQKDLNFNVLKKGHWGGYYYISKSKSAQITNYILKITEPGDLDSLVWAEQPPVANTTTKVKVCYAGPSYKDAESAALKTTEQTTFGMDFSGINERGERVMGLIEKGAVASTVTSDPDLLWPVPEYWTLEEAATVPLPYIHAYYCLAIRAQLTKNKTVFVNGGTGALGQAIISICLSLNCNVFTTVSDTKKKEFLLRLFPELDETHIGQSSKMIFQDMIRLGGLDAGCDLVINCLSGPLREAAMHCVTYNGLFLDLSDHDMINNEDFGMHFLTLSRNYSTARITHLFKPEYRGEKQRLQMLLSDGIANGVVRPISRIIYSQSNVSRAFRLLANSKHRGRVLIKMVNTDSTAHDLNVTSRMTYSSEGSYIIVCEDTIIGMELADRLVKRGARKLTLHLKPNSVAGYCYTKFLSWNNQNVSITISSENLQSEKGCLNLFTEGAKLGPILGIFIVQNLNSGVESFDSEYVAAKFNNTARVVANLDLTSRNICNELEHFIVLNYSGGKITDEYVMSVSDKICEARRDITLPALMYRVDSIKELNDKKDVDRKTQAQPLTSVFTALETSIKMKLHNITTFNLKKDAVSQFLDKIAKIIGVEDIKELDETLELSQLVVNKTAVEEINDAIKKAYEISYPIQKVERMTLADIKHMDKIFMTNDLKHDEGLGTFFTRIVADECLAAEPMLSMATMFSNVKEEEELDPKATYLMLVPGFESHHEVFSTVCERLKVQAVTFQYGPELTTADIPEYAASIMKYMKNRFELKSKFYLLGYSFGVNVALELASLFEKEGLQGVVFCLDSSPDAVRSQLDSYIGNLSDSELQNRIVQHMYKLMSGEDDEEFYKELLNKETWVEKIELCVLKMRALVTYSHQYKRCLLHGAYRRIMLAKEYEPTFKLNSEVVLMKGNNPRIGQLPEDYGLSKYTTNKVQIFQLATDHANATQDCRVTNIVNRFLEPKLQEEFKNKNLCWSYLADPMKTF